MRGILQSISFQPMGDAALIIGLSGDISKETQRWISSVALRLDAARIAGVIEYVPAFNTITVFFDARTTRCQMVEAQIKTLLSGINSAMEPESKKYLEVPVLYGGTYGPDLDLVAAHTGLSPAEVIKRHTAPEYLVYMIGFVPGFPYLGGMDEKIAAPRKDSPRAEIPAGSVGIAGVQTGIYPLQTPGGWQIIGRTPLPLFDLRNHPPALLKAGDTLRFVPVTEADYFRLSIAYGH